MYLLIDIGGSNIRLAHAPDTEAFDEPVIIPTPANFKEAMQAITEAATLLTKSEHTVKAIAVGLPGPLDANKTMTLGVHKLPDWSGQPLKQELEQKLSAPVTIENDTALVGLGEATVGAGKNHAIVAYLTISTGVGGVRIVNGAVDQNTLGFEPGFQIIDLDNSVLVGEAAPTRLEHLLGGTAIEHRQGQAPEDITDPAVWEQAAEWLAAAINNTLVYWSPDVVILGGSIMKSIPFELVRAKSHELASFLPHIPPIEPASLGKFGGLHGGLRLLQSSQS